MPNIKLKKKLAIISFNMLCDKFSTLDSLRALMPNAEYIDPICDGTAARDVFGKIEDAISSKVSEKATVILPFLDAEFTNVLATNPRSLNGYLEHLQSKGLKLVAYVPNKTEFMHLFPRLSPDMKDNMLDMTMFDTETYLKYMSNLNTQTELCNSNEISASRTHFPTQNTQLNTVINSIVFLLLIYMILVASQPEKKHAPRLR